MDDGRMAKMAFPFINGLHKKREGSSLSKALSLQLGLLASLQNGNLVGVEAFVRAGASTNKFSPRFGVTPLSLALMHERCFELAEFLLRHGANPNKHCGSQLRPLEALFVKCGELVDADARFHKTLEPKQYALLQKFEKRPDKVVIPQDEKTPAFLAALANRKAIIQAKKTIRLLVSFKAEINILVPEPKQFPATKGKKKKKKPAPKPALAIPELPANVLSKPPPPPPLPKKKKKKKVKIDPSKPFVKCECCPVAANQSVSLRVCSQCGLKNLDDAHECENCRGDVFVWACIACGLKNTSNDRECDYCGSIAAGSGTTSTRLGVNALFLRHLLGNHIPPRMQAWQVRQHLTARAAKGRDCPLVEILDKQYVGISTVFVSHVYSAAAVDTIEAMLRYEEKHPGSYYWLDEFSFNPHLAGDAKKWATKKFIDSFEDHIHHFKGCLLVAAPWKCPVNLARIWGMFELFASLEAQIPVEIILHEADEAAFVQELEQEARFVCARFGFFDFRTGEAREVEDFRAITSKIETSWSCLQLNKTVSGFMLKWLTEFAFRQEERLKQLQEPEKLAGFQLGLSTFLLEVPGGIELQRAAAVTTACVASLEESFGPSHPATLRGHCNQARILHAQGRVDDATSLLRQTSQTQEAQLGSNSKDALTTYHYLAELLRQAGEDKEAEGLARRVLAGRQQVLGAKHIDTLASQVGLALTVLDQDEAEKLYRAALEGYGLLLGATHPEALKTANLLAKCIVLKGFLDQGETMYRTALDDSRKVLGRSNSITIDNMADLASLLQEKQELVEAEQLARSCVKLTKKAMGKKSLQYLDKLERLVDILKVAHPEDLSEAVELSLKAYKGYEGILGSDHPLTSEAEHKWMQLTTSMHS